MSCFGSSILSRLCTGVPGTRRLGTSFEHFIVTQNIEIAGEQVHTHQGMTLILDTDAGKHRVLKG